MRRLLVLILSLSLVSTTLENKRESFPVIGVLSLPYKGTGNYSNMTESIDPYYSQYLNAAGGVVVPISFKLSEPELRTLMGRLNGVFLGGNLDFTDNDFVYYDEKTKKHELTDYAKAGKTIFDIAKKMNDNKTYFPLWGTCLGFQLFAFLASEDPYILKKDCDCKDYYAPLYFTEDAYREEGMFGFLLKEPMNVSTYNNHSYYIDYLDFLNNTKLDNFFRVLAHSPDKNNSFVYVAAMEGRKYPFFGVQFHPEFKQYNDVSRITNLGLTQKLAHFFVNKTRESKNEMRRAERIEKSIWNTPIYQPEEGTFLYLFP